MLLLCIYSTVYFKLHDIYCWRNRWTSSARWGSDTQELAATVRAGQDAIGGYPDAAAATTTTTTPISSSLVSCCHESPRFAAILYCLLAHLVDIPGVLLPGDDWSMRWDDMRWDRWDWVMVKIAIIIFHITTTTFTYILFVKSLNLHMYRTNDDCLVTSWMIDDRYFNS